MTTVHMIGNAHLDPVWLWRWPAGVAEALLTCRTMVEILDAYPQAIFTRSDVWVYEQIEELDPPLFKRIQQLVAEGRWDVVGGWYIQPDCNLPLAESFRKHMEIGREHHRSKFGIHATVGYNVDSFGHAATLPSLLRAQGYDSYVFMRPGPHEKQLPASIFRWRSPTDGSEVITWRIHQRYNVDDTATLAAYITDLVETCAYPGIDHVMCFYGVGDHGGGPTRSLVEWILENKSSIPGCQLEFSTPRRFFDAVAPQTENLPVVEDELQMHAVGCYTVVHDIKSNVRRAEHLAIQAERTVDRFPGAAPEDYPRVLASAWKQILFNQFHDTFDGTSLPEAYVDARDQVGAAASALATLYHKTLFRRLLGEPGDEMQRLMIYNPGEHPFDGFVSHEPWLDWGLFAGGLLAPDGAAVPYQVIQQPSISGSKRMILWRASVGPGEIAPFRLCHTCEPVESAAGGVADASADESRDAVRNGVWELSYRGGSIALRPSEPSAGEAVGATRADGDGPDRVPAVPLSVSLALIDDGSDTWSHDITGYSTTERERFTFGESEIEESGPLRAAVRSSGNAGASMAVVRSLVYAESSVAEIELTLHWNERLTIAKLIFDFEENVVDRSDGIPGGRLDRVQNGYEYPVVDSTIVRLASGRSVGIVAPDCFGIDGVDSRVRFTLLRSPAHAWQGRKGGIDPEPHHSWTDRGAYRFRFFIVSDATEKTCDSLAEAAHEPPTILDWTTGMTSERGTLPVAAPWA